MKGVVTDINYYSPLGVPADTVLHASIHPSWELLQDGSLHSQTAASEWQTIDGPLALGKPNTKTKQKEMASRDQCP